ncbi:hypothetical protein FB45DRAFT_865590 [Roridomyces roridus]|uniref:Uncharacterized protein n=1 Tax=Roridomyces roridus TaxID=1738132 RepID=A0AAD7BZU1_9AGAR|nr:hypothetical protein FB45DRAFT_865590 [Roridomyces roridus]
MSVERSLHDSLSTSATMPTFRRKMSQNEISYFLPSRAYGLNDMFTRLIFRAPPALVSPFRLRVVWAIMRLRHSLMACRFEMAPGCYDHAQFVYTPPANANAALAETNATVRMFDDVTGPELMQSFLSGQRTLSADRLAMLHVANHGEVSLGTNEYHLLVMFHHGINDSLAVMRTIHLMVGLLCGPGVPGGAPRTDAELSKVLDDEWGVRWATPRDPGDVIVPATEARILGLPRSKIAEAAWKVDHKCLQERAIGGHVFPKLLKNRVAKARIFQVKFSIEQTNAIRDKCKAERVTPQNVVFGLCNMAWMRLCANHPEIDAPKTLPMLMYTSVSIRRYLNPVSPLSSYMSLALDYCNVVLPAYLSTSVDPRAVFWARSREAQRQMFGYTHSPLLLRRAVTTSAARGKRAKAFARADDAADGTLPPLPPPSASIPPSPPSAPSLALIGVSQIGSIDPIFDQSAYPAVELVDIVGGVRKAPGGITLFSRTFLGRFNMTLVWDAAAFKPGLMEEFWRGVVDGVHEFVLGDPSGRAEELEPTAMAPVGVKSRL